MRALEAQQPKKQIKMMASLPPNGISNEKQFEGFIVRLPLSLPLCLLSVYALLSLELFLTPALENNRKAEQTEEDGKQDGSLAREPAHGQDHRLLPKVQLLVYASLAR